MFELQPDVIFLITDGVLNRKTVSYPEIPYETFLSPVRQFERNLSDRPRIHIIGFEMKPDDAANMGRLASSFGGQVRFL